MVQRHNWVPVCPQGSQSVLVRSHLFSISSYPSYLLMCQAYSYFRLNTDEESKPAQTVLPLFFFLFFFEVFLIYSVVLISALQ